MNVTPEIRIEREQPKVPVNPAVDGLLRATVRQSWKELDALRPTWERLLDESAGSTIFSTPEWLGAWWKAFGREQRLTGIVFSDSSGQPVGLALCYVDLLETFFRRRLRRLRLVGDGSGDSDNLDFVVRAGYEEACARTFLAWLAGQPGWDVCELNTLPGDSALGNCLLRHLKQLDWPHVVYHRPCSAITLPDSWESYLRQVSPKENEKLGYRFRRLERRYRVCFCKCTREEDIHTYLEELFQLHEKRWQARGQPGTFASPARRQFYYEIAVSFLVRRWLEFWLLKLDGRTVAAQFGFRYGSTVFALQRGFDPAHSADSVGYVLLGHVLRQLIGEGVRRYDFLGGEYEHKARWKAQSGVYLHVHFARPLTKGSLHLRAMHDARMTKEWLRSHLPRPAWSLLRSLYHMLRSQEDQRAGSQFDHQESGDGR